jgi:putative addiction module killer protein
MRPASAATFAWRLRASRVAIEMRSSCQLLLLDCIFWDTLVTIEVRGTEIYARWFTNLRDAQARARILSRIRRLSLGNPGDVASAGAGVSEMRIDYGPGYRVNYVVREQTVVILLAGGDKSSQQRDINRAIELAREL